MQGIVVVGEGANLVSVIGVRGEVSVAEGEYHVAMGLPRLPSCKLQLWIYGFESSVDPPSCEHTLMEDL